MSVASSGTAWVSSCLGLVGVCHKVLEPWEDVSEEAYQQCCGGFRGRKLRMVAGTGSLKIKSGRRVGAQRKKQPFAKQPVCWQLLPVSGSAGCGCDCLLRVVADDGGGGTNAS